MKRTNPSDGQTEVLPVNRFGLSTTFSDPPFIWLTGDDQDMSSYMMVCSMLQGFGIAVVKRNTP